MLEKSELITGQDAKVFNELVESYQDITAKIKDLQEVQKGIATQVKEMCGHAGTFETTKYIQYISARKGADKFDKKGLEKDYPDIFSRYNTINEEVTLVIGKTVLKGERV